VPDWITEPVNGKLATTEELPPQEEEPAWMAQLREAPPAPFSEQIPVHEDSETPDWLAQLQISEPTLEKEPVAGEESDWLSQLGASRSEVETAGEEKTGLDLGVAAAGLAGAALFAAHEAGEEEAKLKPEPEPPLDLARPSELGAADLEHPVSVGIAAPAEEAECQKKCPALTMLAFLAKLAAKGEINCARKHKKSGRAWPRSWAVGPRGCADNAKKYRQSDDSAGSNYAAVAAGLAAMPTKQEEPSEPQAAESIPENAQCRRCASISIEVSRGQGRPTPYRPTRSGRAHGRDRGASRVSPMHRPMSNLLRAAATLECSGDCCRSGSHVKRRNSC
jgi:hypothetical protein